MRQYLNKRCKIRVLNEEGKRLHFTADPVTNVTDTHISFTDKFGKPRSYLIKDVVEIYEEEVQ